MVEMTEKRRRKSLRLFGPRPETPSTAASLPSDTSSPVEKRLDLFASATPDDSETSSPRIRPRTLQKTSRTTVFGSLKSLNAQDEDERVYLTRSDSKASSMHEDGNALFKGRFGETLIHHGEVQAGGNSMFRKKCHYLVLTESHLIRFKNQSKACEVYPSLPPLSGRPTAPRTSGSSIGSFTELHSSISNDVTQGIALEQIVAVYKLDDGRPFFSIEISYLDETARKSSVMQLQFSEPREAELWRNAIRDAANHSRSSLASYFQAHTLEYIARSVEREGDYDASHFHPFKAVQITASKSSGRSSLDDIAKITTTVCYLVVGINKVHFVPVPRLSSRSSTTSLVDTEAPTSFGIVNLVSIHLQPGDDAFTVNFRPPFDDVHQISLASNQSSEIVLWLRYACEYVLPEWTTMPFLFDVPEELDDKMAPPNLPKEDHNCFERTLTAYCAAYHVDTSKVVYTVEYGCEDEPRFRLLPPTSDKTYTNLELLAVIRSLRYNEFFASISFAGIDLRALRDTYDSLAHDSNSRLTRSGVVINLPGHEALPVLMQEIRALAIKSRRLRRLDFSSAMSMPSDNTEERQSCGIPEALAPLCKKSLTNIDWVILNGILLGDSDLDHLVDTASDRRSHLRALEIGDCGLSVHDIDVLLSTLAVHENTMEVINLSGAQGRFSPELFQRGIGAFSRIRRLNLTRVQKTAGPEPLVAPEIMLSWRLEALHLGQTTLNEQSVDGLSAYLASPKSDLLRELHLNQCGLTGKDLAIFLQAMTRRKGEAREMHVNASENRLSLGFSSFTKSLAEGYGPSSLSIRMTDFSKEHQFRELINALAVNSTLRCLDISRASLPYDAGDATCEAIKDMFARNETLRELDISGEHAHLDAAKFGIGLNIALRGLEKNKTLKLLRIEHQGLGLQGANTLAGVLEANTSLLEIHCEHNEINLQSFTVLVNALEKNQTLMYLPDLLDDKSKSIEKVKSEFDSMNRNPDHKLKSLARSGTTLKKGISVFGHRGLKSGHHRHSSSVASNTSFTEQDIMATIEALEEKWQYQLARLQKYLMRNYCVSNGLDWCDDDDQLPMTDVDEVSGRPGTAESLGKLLARVRMDRTPTIEKPSLLEPFDEKLMERKPAIFQLPRDDFVE